MKDELGGEIKNEFEVQRPRMYSFLTDCSVDKKAKDIKLCVIKQKIKFQDYTESLEKNKTILKSQQRFRSESHNVSSKKVNTIALSVYDDKRIQTPDEVFSNLHGVDPEKVCKQELLKHPKNKKMSIMINFNEVKGEKILEHNSRWPQIFHHSYRILIVGGS